MSKYVVGLDGGGTKTAVNVSDSHSNILYEFSSGAINYNGESSENVEWNLKKIFDEIALRSDGFDECECICIGVAGISNPQAKEALKNAVFNCGYKGMLFIAGDHETALYGALGKPCGIILIAGTGSICYGKNNRGEEHRTGGFGYLIDDEGSGYSIGRDILSAVVRSFDGRIGNTVLTEMVFKQLEIASIHEVIEFVYGSGVNKRDIAKLAPNLTAACAKNDPVSISIVDKCSNELVQLVIPVAEKLGLGSGDIAIAGSVLLKDEYIRAAFVNKINMAFPGLKCVYPRYGAAYGAVLMALEIVGYGSDKNERFK
jgi:N-acetylglucosamine kinase-like BadF-type ATPase